MSEDAQRGLVARDPQGEQVAVVDPVSLRDVEPCSTQPLLPLVMEMLNDPDEIWYEWTDQPLGGAAACFEMERPGVVRRYLARFQLGDELVNVTGLTTVARDGWRLREVHVSETALNAARCGWLAYRRG